VLRLLALRIETVAGITVFSIVDFLFFPYATVQSRGKGLSLIDYAEVIPLPYFGWSLSPSYLRPLLSVEVDDSPSVP